MLVQDLGKFQKHRCLHASRVQCPQTSSCQRGLEPLIFVYEFYHYKYTILLACHRPKLEKM